MNIRTLIHDTHTKVTYYYRYTVWMAILITLLTGCSRPEGLDPLSDEEKQKVLQVHRYFSQSAIVLYPDGQEEPVYLGVENCAIYKAERVHGIILDWQKIISKPFYLLPTVCTIQKTRRADDYVYFDFGVTSVGAGGCCANRSAYRTRDGVIWHKKEKELWVTVTLETGKNGTE